LINILLEPVRWLSHTCASSSRRQAQSR